MKILVTGATGFIGQVAARHLVEHGHDVTGMAHSIDSPWLPDGVRPVEADLADLRRLRAALRGRSFDAVVHLAASTNAWASGAAAEHNWRVNVTGTENLLIAAGAPMVFTSTCMVYKSSDEPLAEDAPVAPVGAYGRSKLAAEDIVRGRCAGVGCGAVVLRLFNVAGADRGYVDHSPSRIMGNVIRAATGEIPYVSINGDGTAVREFTHVVDAAEALRLGVELAQSGSVETLNIGTGDGVSIRDVIAAASRIAGVAIPVEHRPPVPEPSSLVADPSRAAEVLSWRPNRSGIEQILGDLWSHRRLLM